MPQGVPNWKLHEFRKMVSGNVKPKKQKASIPGSAVKKRNTHALRGEGGKFVSRPPTKPRPRPPAPHKMKPKSDEKKHVWCGSCGTKNELSY